MGCCVILDVLFIGEFVMMIFNEFCVGLLDDLLYVVSLLLFVDVIDLYFELVFVIVVGFEVCV